MSTQQIISIVVTVIGVALIGFALWAQRKFEAMRATKTVHVTDVASRSPGDGLTCELKGKARPGPAGRLKAPLSKRQCVWYLVKIEERWREYHRDGDGRGHHSRHSRTLREDGSPPHFHLNDGTGAALIDLRGTKVDAPTRSFHRAVPARKAGSGLKELAFELLSNKEDHEIVRTEWIVQGGQAIYALGKAGPDPQTGNVALRQPDEGPFIVSTRSEEQLSKGAVIRMRIGYIGGGVLFAGGAVALVVTSLLL